jgi:cytochrome P450
MYTQRSIPGPTGLHTIRTLFNYYRDPLQTFQNLRNTYGDIFQIKFWKYHIIHLTNPDDILAVLQNPNFEVSTALSAADPLVGKGLSTNTGEDWLRQRRMIQPAFHHERISKYLEKISVETQKMLTRWEVYAAHQTVFDLTKELVALNHAQLYSILFGDEILPANQEILDALKFVRIYTVQKANALISLPQIWPTPNNRRFWQAVKLLDQFIYGLIKKRRNSLADNGDILTFMIQAHDKVSGQVMPDKQLHDEIITLFFAAYEDAANALSWAFFQLSQNSQDEQRLYTEVDEAIQKNKFDFETLQKLPYNSQIIDETLRLYPPTWSLLRDVIKDEQLRRYRIPKGAIVFINTYLLHHHPNYWQEPEKFDPERFSAEKAALIRKPVYIPFGSGSRKCIGYSLALTQMRANLVLIAKKFQIIPHEPGYVVKIETDSSLRMEGGFPVTVSVRRQEISKV